MTSVPAKMAETKSSKSSVTRSGKVAFLGLGSVGHVAATALRFYAMTRGGLHWLSLWPLIMMETWVVQLLADAVERRPLKWRLPLEAAIEVRKLGVLPNRFRAAVRCPS